MIPSPYNFVQLSQQVFFPPWADQVSMDVPFADGLCGSLQIRVIARTPIYIRSGGAHAEGQQRLDDPNYLDFFRAYPGGPYAIPGTSLKGLLRNVVEIASFGKVAGTEGKQSRVSNHRYAVRDLQNPHLYGNHITQTVAGAYEPKVKAAWLTEDPNGDWSLQICDFGRVEQSDLRTYHGTQCQLGFRRQSAAEKYDHWKKPLAVAADVDPIKAYPHSNGKLRYARVGKLGCGVCAGTLVFTGQPVPDTDPHKPGRKHMEFFFFNAAPAKISVPDDVKKDFVFAHSELGENRCPNVEWKFWESKLAIGRRVPVFVLFDGTKLDSMGLAMMFRLPYKRDIFQAIGRTTADHLDATRADLAELIFGRVDDHDALRGRVSVETLVAEGAPEAMADKVITVLNGPKPTYYPNYVRQRADEEGNLIGEYKTYMDADAEIRGWKRYIVREDSPNMPAYDRPPTNNHGQENLAVATAFRPLPAGTVFTGTIHVHNLRPEELGALVWAITWGKKPNLRHLLGMGKPYGFGSVTVEITSCDLISNEGGSAIPCDIKAFCKPFADMMQNWHKDSLQGPWEQSDQIRALRNLANPATVYPMEIRYPALGNGPRDNEFVQHKQAPKQVLYPAASLEMKKPNKPVSTQTAPVTSLVAPVIANLKENITTWRAKAVKSALDAILELTQGEFDEIGTVLKKRPDYPSPKYNNAYENLRKKIKGSGT